MRATYIVFHQTITWLLVGCWLFGSTAATAAPSTTRLDATLLAGLVRVLRPLVGEAITRKLSRGFEVTNQLGAAIAQDRDRVAQQASLVPWLSIADVQTLIGWLYTVPQRTVTAPLPMQTLP